MVAAHVLADLGREQHPVTLAAGGQPLADEGFGLVAAVPAHSARIDVGGVDQVKAAVDKSVQQRKRSRLVGGPTENVAAKGQRGDLQAGAAQFTTLHGFLLLPGRAGHVLSHQGLDRSEGKGVVVGIVSQRCCFWLASSGAAKSAMACLPRTHGLSCLLGH